MGHPVKQFSREPLFKAIVSVPSSMVMFIKAAQSRNAQKPTEATEFGIVMAVSAAHSPNAKSPILVTELGITIVLSTAKDLKA